MSDYNRRVAEALGFRPEPNSTVFLPDFERDWSQLPAILAGLDAYGQWVCERRLHVTPDTFCSVYVGEGILGSCLGYTQSSNLLLAAGALLLKMKEAKP